MDEVRWGIEHLTVLKPVQHRASPTSMLTSLPQNSSNLDPVLIAHQSLVGLRKNMYFHGLVSRMRPLGVAQRKIETGAKNKMPTHQKIICSVNHFSWPQIEIFWAQFFWPQSTRLTYFLSFASLFDADRVYMHYAYSHYPTHQGEIQSPNALGRTQRLLHFIISLL